MRFTTEFKLSGRDGREGGLEVADEEVVVATFVFEGIAFDDGVLDGAAAGNAVSHEDMSVKFARTR